MPRFGKTTFPKARFAAQKWSRVQDARPGFPHRAKTVALWLTLPQSKQTKSTRIKPSRNWGVHLTPDVDFLSTSSRRCAGARSDKLAEATGPKIAVALP